MSELAACRMCLAVDARMYTIAGTPLQHVYERITDIPLQNGDKMPQKVCYLCCHLLRKNQAFMEKSVKADELLRLVLDRGIELTEAYIKLMDTSGVCCSLGVSRQVLEDFVPQEQCTDEETQICVKDEPPEVKQEFEIEIEGIGLYGSGYSATVETGRTTPKHCTVADTLEQPDETSFNDINIKQESGYTPDVDMADDNILLHCARNSQISNEDFLNDSSIEESVENTLIRHMLIHTEIKPHRCSFCNKAFSDKNNLNEHILIHTREKPHRCSYCARTFPTKSDYDQHVLTHSGDKPYQCSYCRKTFPTNSHFNQHMLTHTGEKPHQCRHCNKAFTSKNTLNRHILIHTGEKPYRCTHCNRDFSQKSSLNHHILMHTGEKPHQCSVCSRAFTNKRTLNRHMLIHTGEKPYQCSVCKRDFRQKDYLNQHMLIHVRENNLKMAQSSS